ncbi:hypothetical protein, partial [Methanopyrus kandleri]
RLAEDHGLSEERIEVGAVDVELRAGGDLPVEYPLTRGEGVLVSARFRVARGTRSPRNPRCSGGRWAS